MKLKEFTHTPFSITYPVFVPRNRDITVNENKTFVCLATNHNLRQGGGGIAGGAYLLTENLEGVNSIHKRDLSSKDFFSGGGVLKFD